MFCAHSVHALGMLWALCALFARSVHTMCLLVMLSECSGHALGSVRALCALFARSVHTMCLLVMLSALSTQRAFREYSESTMRELRD